MRPDYYVRQWSDWKYNKVANLGTGENYGERVAVVQEEFANAIMAIPELASQHKILTEEELAIFWDTKHAVEQDDDIVNEVVLTKLKVRRDLMATLGKNTASIDAKIEKALDPNDKEAGVKANEEKTWSKFKTKRKLVLRVMRF